MNSCPFSSTKEAGTWEGETGASGAFLYGRGHQAGPELQAGTLPPEAGCP